MPLSSARSQLPREASYRDVRASTATKRRDEEKDSTLDKMPTLSDLKEVKEEAKKEAPQTNKDLQKSEAEVQAFARESISKHKEKMRQSGRRS